MGPLLVSVLTSDSPHCISSMTSWSPSVLRCVCISDTHSNHSQLCLPPGDLLLHAGNFTKFGSMSQLEEFDQWLGEQSFQHRIVVPGNQDNLMDPYIRQTKWGANEKKNLFIDDVVEMKGANWSGDDAEVKNYLKNAVVLVDDSIEIEGLIIFGSPHTRLTEKEATEGSYYNAFKYKREDFFEQKLLKMKGANIVMTQMPPYETGDLVVAGFGLWSWFDDSTPSGTRSNIGSTVLRDAVVSEEPGLHIFGHALAGRGIYREPGEAIMRVNVANFGKIGEKLRQPMVIDVDKKTGKVVEILRV